MENCKYASVALLIDAGSFNDPPNINGLAHLVEHMTFMGSEKYPRENDFDSFIIKCGGNFNGETNCENLIFYFHINDNYLEAALDRFTELFSKPLLLKETMKNERLIVESEFKSKMQNDMLRREQILSSMANQEHPCSKFGWGNLKTLNDKMDDDTLHDAILDFRSKYYSADRMYLCLRANRNVEEIQNLVVKFFSQIPTRSDLVDDFSRFNHNNVFRDEFFENVVFVKPIFDGNTLEITWCLPPMINEYKSKPYQYVSYILNHRGNGSLYAYLKKKHWAFDISAGFEESISFEFNSLYCLFVLCIFLTEEGFNNLKNVLEVIFAYMKIIEETDPDEELFVELRNMYRIFAASTSASCPSEIVHKIKYYPIKDILKANKVLFEYDPKSIIRFIKTLNGTKFNLMITSKNCYNGVVYDKKEKWFGTEYGVMKMPTEWLNLQKNCKMIPELSFPVANNLVLMENSLSLPNDQSDDRDTGSLYSSENNSIQQKNGDDDDDDSKMMYPKKILDIDICELWHKEEELGETGYMHFSFLTPLLVVHPRNELIMEFWVFLIKNKLIDYLSREIQIENFYDIYLSERGFILEIFGSTDKLYYLTDLVTKTIKRLNETFAEDEIYVYLKEMKDFYKNLLIDPETLNYDIRFGVLQKIWWLSIEKYNLISSINLEQIEAFSMIIFREIRIKGLIQGDVKETDALKITNLVYENLSCCPIQNLEDIRVRICRLPLGTSHIICKSFNFNDVNTVITNIYQIGKYKIKSKCILDLIMLIVAQPLFNELRTKMKLAYSVSFNVSYYYGILDYLISIISQEDKFNSNYIEDQLDNFHNRMIEIISNLNDYEYLHYRNSLIQHKYCNINNFVDQMNHFFKEIMFDEYKFSRKQEEINYLKNITKNDVIEFLKKRMKNFRKLSIQVVGHKTNDDENSNLKFVTTDNLQLILEENSIKDIETFKNNLCFYT